VHAQLADVWTSTCVLLKMALG